VRDKWNPQEHDLDDLEVTLEPPPEGLIQKMIPKTHPHKAPGPDKIPNVVLRKSIDTISPILHNSLLIILTLSYYPKAWQTWSTIVLRKPGHTDYTVAKA